MAKIGTTKRRNNVPFIHVRGTHYETGFAIGRTFKSMIQSYVSIHGPLNNEYLPLWETSPGKEAYESTLAVVEKNFPQYLEEMRGTAEGAEVPFHKLFLLHMDEILPCSVASRTGQHSAGCSTVCCNFPEEIFIGHNEDALAETFGHFYCVSAHIEDVDPKGRWKTQGEKFTSLCYAGTLPGFTMSYNSHGFLFTVNVIRVKDMQAGKSPRSILTRALLSAENISQVINILKNSGTGIGDGVNINFTFLKDQSCKKIYSAEVGPSKFPQTDSLIDVLEIGPGEKFYRSNRYTRLKCPEDEGILKIGTRHREAAMYSLPTPNNSSEVVNLLGDETDTEYPVFRDSGKTQTIATGVFDLKKLTWRVYVDNPKTTEFILELPISF